MSGVEQIAIECAVARAVGVDEVYMPADEHVIVPSPRVAVNDKIGETALALGGQAHVPQSAETKPNSRPEYAAMDDEIDALMNRFAEQPSPLTQAERAAIVERIVSLWLPRLALAAYRYRHTSQDLADLRQVAALGLLEAIHRYDPARGNGLGPFAQSTMDGKLKRYIRDKGWMVRPTRSTQELYQEVRNAWPRLAQELGRTPTVTDLAAALDLTEAEVLTGQSAGVAYRARSLDRNLNANDDDPVTYSDYLGTDDPGFDLAENLTVLAPLIPQLPVRQRRMLAMRYFEDMTQTQIAKELGISQMHVSRQLNEALGRLRQGLRTGRCSRPLPQPRSKKSTPVA